MTSSMAVQHQLRAAILRIAHAHDFSKTSSLAISVLVDLLSGFFELLVSAAAEHARLARRTFTNCYDALSAFEELGIDIYEVIQWCRRDGLPSLEYQRPLPRYSNGLAEALSAGLSKRDGPSVILEYREIIDSAENSPILSPSEGTPSPGSKAFLPSPNATNQLGGQTATRVRQERNSHSLLYQEPALYSEFTAGQELFAQLPEPPDRENLAPTAWTHPFLLIAMQSAQENMAAGNANPARLAISSTMSAVATMRYAASDSLFSSSLPPSPRCLAPAPPHPIPQHTSAPTTLLPPPQPRSIRSQLSDALHPQPGSLSTHIGALAERVVKPGVQDRSSMILPPIAFVDNGTPYLYGNPIRAAWNKANGQQSRSDKPSALTDALLYKTWPTVQKNPEEELKGEARSCDETRP